MTTNIQTGSRIEITASPFLPFGTTFRRGIGPEYVVEPDGIYEVTGQQHQPNAHQDVLRNVQTVLAVGEDREQSLARYKQRFATVIRARAHASGVGLGPVEAAVRTLTGETAQSEPLRLGMWVGGRDQDLLYRLPIGTVLRSGYTDHYDRSVVVQVNDEHALIRLFGGRRADASLTYCVVAFPSSVEPALWPRETYPDAQGDDLETAILRFKRQVWEVSRPLKSQHGYCGDLENGLGRVGIVEGLPPVGEDPRTEFTPVIGEPVATVTDMALAPVGSRVVYDADTAWVKTGEDWWAPVHESGNSSPSDHFSPYGLRWATPLPLTRFLPALNAPMERRQCGAVPPGSTISVPGDPSLRTRQGDGSWHDGVNTHRGYPGAGAAVTSYPQPTTEALASSGSVTEHGAVLDTREIAALPEGAVVYYPADADMTDGDVRWNMTVRTNLNGLGVERTLHLVGPNGGSHGGRNRLMYDGTGVMHIPVPRVEMLDQMPTGTVMSNITPEAEAQGASPTYWIKGSDGRWTSHRHAFVQSSGEFNINGRLGFRFIPGDRGVNAGVNPAPVPEEVF